MSENSTPAFGEAIANASRLQALTVLLDFAKFANRHQGMALLDQIILFVDQEVILFVDQEVQAVSAAQ